MKPGSLLAAGRRSLGTAIILILAIVLSVGLLTFTDLSRPFTALWSIVSVVSGALLGNYARHDYSQNIVVNQARPSVRHLFQQVDRLRKLVLRAEEYGQTVSRSSIEPVRVADWFADLGVSLRNEIEATTGAIENWGDLTPETQDEELHRYKNRTDRLPGTFNEDGKADSK